MLYTGIAKVRQGTEVGLKPRNIGLIVRCLIVDLLQQMTDMIGRQR